MTENIQVNAGRGKIATFVLKITKPLVDIVKGKDMAAANSLIINGTDCKAVFTPSKAEDVLSFQFTTSNNGLSFDFNNKTVQQVRDFLTEWLENQKE